MRDGGRQQRLPFQSGCERSKLPLTGQYGGSDKEVLSEDGTAGTGVCGRVCICGIPQPGAVYGETVSGLEKIAGRTYDSIHIIGGGSNAAYLNQLTADATGKTVYAGPGEATAIGNLLAQMIYAEELTDLKSARQCVRDSFEIKTFVPAK